MNIVFEGPDGGGKSTLVKRVQERFDRIAAGASIYDVSHRFAGWSTQHSGGPAKSTEEIDARVRDYLARDRVIFDRYPAISSPIYSTIFNGIGGPSQELIDQFYATKPLLIYCRATSPDRHEVKPDDHAKRFLDRIAPEYHRLVYLYDQWAAEHANLIFRIGDDTEKFLRSIEARVW